MKCKCKCPLRGVYTPEDIDFTIYRKKGVPINEIRITETYTWNVPPNCDVKENVYCQSWKA